MFKLQTLHQEPHFFAGRFTDFSVIIIGRLIFLLRPFVVNLCFPNSFCCLKNLFLKSEFLHRFRLFHQIFFTKFFIIYIIVFNIVLNILNISKIIIFVKTYSFIAICYIDAFFEDDCFFHFLFYFFLFFYFFVIKYFSYIIFFSLTDLFLNYYLIINRNR
jgi:hypothetical protein